MRLNSIKLRKIIALGIGAIISVPSVLAMSPTIFNNIAANGEDTQTALQILQSLSSVKEKSGKYVYEDVPIHTNLSSSSVWPNGLNYARFPGLWHGDVAIDMNGVNDDYITHEEVSFPGASLETGLSLIATSNSPSENYGDKPFIKLLSNQVKYTYIFDEPLNVNNRLSNTSIDKPIRLKILGKPIEIIGATDNSLTLLTGDYCTLRPGEYCEVKGHKVRFKHGSNNGAEVEVDDSVSEWILEEKDRNFDNGLNIFVEKVHDLGQSKDDFEAELWISDKEARKEYTHQSPFIGEDTNMPALAWEFAGLKSTYPSINVTWWNNADKPDEVIYVGQSEAIMNGQLKISPEKLTKPASRAYDISVGAVDVYTDETSNTVLYTSWPAIKISGNSSNKDSVKVSGKEADAAWIMINTAGANPTQLGLAYRHPDYERAILVNNITVNQTNNAFTLEFEQTSLQVGVFANWVGMLEGEIGPVNADGTQFQEINITFYENASYTSGDNYNLKLYTKFDTYKGPTYLGHSAGYTTVTEDWRYEKNASDGVDISLYKKNARTDAGIVIVEPYNSAPSDQFKIYVPEEISDFDVRISLSTASAKILNSTVLLPISADESIVNSPSSADTSQPIILVGGPCANKLTADALGLTFPACGTASGLTEKEAVIKLVEGAINGQSALLVYGWGAEDTKAAAEKIVEFTGTEIRFKVGELATS